MNDFSKYEVLTVQEKWNMLAMVANLYYNSDMTQSEIAKRLFTSRSKISRMLKEARELGIVQITINEPWERNLDLENEIRKRYHIDTIRVINTKDYTEEQIVAKMSEDSAYYFDSIVKENMVIGISWGNTLYHFVEYVGENNKKNLPIEVVPIMGASGLNIPDRDSMDLAKKLASSYGGRYQYLYAPLFVKDKTLKESLIQEEAVHAPLELVKRADIILTSIGSVEHRSWNNYLTDKVFDYLKKHNAVGHIGGHFFDIDGNEIRSTLNERQIGVSFEDLARCKNVVCIAYGAHKANALKGGLSSGVINTLIVSSECASKIVADEE